MTLAAPSERPLTYEFMTPAMPMFRQSILWSLFFLGGMVLSGVANAQGKTDDNSALALYADAANFQTNGANDLAITNWKSFLDRYPKHAMASKAAHYLGVCYMQATPPELKLAVDAFDLALLDKDLELREQSLSNLGYCQFAAAETKAGGDLSAGSKELLRKSLQTHRTLLSDFPQSRYRDRAYFYSAESSYALGDKQEAVDSYTAMMQLNDVAKSTFYCDGMYARGVAQEELKQYDDALKSYQQLLGSKCGTSAWYADIWLRIGDIHAAKDSYDEALKAFAKVLGSSDNLVTDADRAYALFRQGFVYAKTSRPADAMKSYEKLIQSHPDSTYAATAKLSAGQTAYQSGDLAVAAKRFREVLTGKDAAASTEAAHWLARLELAKTKAGDLAADDPKIIKAAEEAFAVAQKQLDAGPSGQYAVALRLDAAESLSLLPDRVKESLELFAKIAESNPEDPLAPRALYNAAYSALQLDQYDRAIQLANRFIDNYGDDDLRFDVRFVEAESKLLSGQAARSGEAYKKLIEAPDARNNPAWPYWVLRTAAALTAAKDPRQAADLLTKHMEQFKQPRQKAEAWLQIGQAEMDAGNSAAAAAAFAKSRDADPKFGKSGEAMLMAAEAELQAGNVDSAVDIWKQVVDENPNSEIADQASFRIGQTAAKKSDFQSAIDAYRPILDGARNADLVAYARYGQGYAEMQLKRYDDAVASLTSLINDSPKHPLVKDSLLTRGIALRNLDQFERARKDLQTFLDSGATGINAGHALYELALLDQNDRQPKRAAERLQSLVAKVPNYPLMNKVMYELAWSLHESEQDAAAVNQFNQFIAKYPKDELVGEAAYFVGQSHYQNEKWVDAIAAYEIAADLAPDADLMEKSLYRLGWSYYKLDRFKEAETVFVRQYGEVPNGPLLLDAMLMIGESRFKRNEYPTALRAYTKAREKIVADNDQDQSVRDPAARQVRELVLLHGGQSAAQLMMWDDAIQWYDELRERFPATVYLPQLFYETGFAHQQAGRNTEALKYYSQVADNYRNVLSARARFMMGEIHFGSKKLDEAIPEFQRVMFGFGADKAPPDIQNWQAKSGFEAGRCAELLMQEARTDSAKAKAKDFARTFYTYVVSKHPQHELVRQAQKRLENLK